MPSFSDVAAPAPLLAVDRAAAEFRRGGLVVILAKDQPAVLAEAAEACTADSWTSLTAAGGEAPRLLVTARRAQVMGLQAGAGSQAGSQAGVAPVIALGLPEPVEDALLEVLSDPAAASHLPAPPPRLPAGSSVAPVQDGSAAAAAVTLAKLARLLPAAAAATLAVEDPAAWAAARDIPRVQAEDIFHYHQTAARTLRRAGEARVPLVDAENARVLAFRPADGGIEHLAIVIGDPDPARPVLARLHSECFTGDLLGSLRCDCGDQLRGAILNIAQAGSGILLYLAQEGRGIGLVNKLRAYRLQDAGYDTLDANGQLGFDDDERIYQPAAEMLRQLGFARVRLMTNNPAKVEALARHDVEVVERVPHIFQSNVHNLSYLRTKALKGGHLF